MKVREELTKACQEGSPVRPLKSPDHAARVVLVSCYLYYVLDSPTLGDSEYDTLVEVVVEGWAEVDPLRRWQLGSPSEIRATGHHVRYTMATVSAAHMVYEGLTGERVPKHLHPRKWKTSKKHKVRYLTA